MPTTQVSTLTVSVGWMIRKNAIPSAISAITIAKTRTPRGSSTPKAETPSAMPSISAQIPQSTVSATTVSAGQVITTIPKITAITPRMTRSFHEAFRRSRMGGTLPDLTRSGRER